MKYLLNHKEMKAVDCYSIETIGIPSLVLMERAALAVASHLQKKVTKKDKILAVSGNGNNGADAVAAARILYNMGYDAEVYLAASPEKISPELDTQLKIAVNLDMKVYIQTQIPWENYDWIIDGVFGIGLSRTVSGKYAEVIDQINAAAAKVCAVDIPSGIYADNGQILGCAVHADMTVTFGYDKIGMILYPGAEYAGELYVENIGFAKDAAKRLNPKVFAIESSDVKQMLPKRHLWSNKGTYGRLLVIAGKKNMCGAALLCAHAAYKMGVGLVKIVTPEENRVIIQSGLPEAVLDTYQLNDLNREWIQGQLDWADAVVIGPGMGTGAQTDMFLDCVLNCTKPTVIDADALNTLSVNLSRLKKHQGPVIITPHLGEMSRLVGCQIKEIQADLVSACQAFASEFGVVCVLKDARTIISDGNLYTLINTTGNNGMSTGGSGDVLAGIIGGLLVGDKSAPFWQTAALGTYIHGLCGDEAKKFTGVYGLLASDIIKYMSNVLDVY